LRGAEPELGAQPDIRWRRGREIAPELDGYWVGAFLMAAVNTRIVQRSNALLDYTYGRRFEYAEQLSMGRSFAAPVAAAMGTGNAATMALGSRYFDRLPRKLVERIAPKPGTGPSERAREQGHYLHHDNHRRALQGHHVAEGRPRATRRHRCFAVKVDWRSRWTATGCRICVVCSPRRQQWATRCSPDSPLPECYWRRPD